jgi:hypothetical protein
MEGSFTCNKKCPHCDEHYNTVLEKDHEYKCKILKLEAENARLKKDIRLNRPDLQMVLIKYSDFLHKEGYTDADYYAEEPKAIDRFLDDYFNDK